MFDLSDYSPKSKNYYDLTKLVVGNMKDETIAVAIEEFVGLKPKVYSMWVDDSGDHRKAKGMDKNIVERISHSEYKDVWQNRKHLRHSMNRIQSEDHRKETYEINKRSLSCLDDKIHTLSN